VGGAALIGAGLTRAVVFDLWETLVDWDQAGSAELTDAIAQRAGLETESFRRRWLDDGTRFVTPIRESLRTAGIPDEALEDVCALRLEANRRWLVPRPGAIETLDELRRRGLQLGLISVCTDEVALAWPETPFAGRFAATVFSSAVGLAKPDPRIYEHCLGLLGVAAHEAVFVGDGANDELAGAQRVGMDAILIHRAGEDPLWPEVLAWDGPRVTSIPEVLEVLPLC
jgi:putative hydrolase of the HAD superfamily